jgi:hypothetical protein
MICSLRLHPRTEDSKTKHRTLFDCVQCGPAKRYQSSLPKEAQDDQGTTARKQRLAQASEQLGRAPDSVGENTHSSTARRVSVALPGDVVFELLDDELLLGDGGFDQVSDGDKADQLAAVHDR